ncbi:hypothetical protein RYX36_020888, partial [Vicia faba]
MRLCRKPSILVLIDELEKLRQPLSVALTKELDLALQNNRETLTENSVMNSVNSANQNGDVVEDILNFLYFGSLFEVKTQNDFTSTILKDKDLEMIHLILK